MASDSDRPAKKARAEEDGLDAEAQSIQPCQPGQEGAQQQGNASSAEAGPNSVAGVGMSSLPRPPPLTIPQAPNPSTLANLGQGLSPLPSLLLMSSPGLLTLDTLASARGLTSPGFQAIINQITSQQADKPPGSTGSGGAAEAANGAAAADAGAGNAADTKPSLPNASILLGGITPTLISPNLQWPDTMRGAGMNALRGLEDFTMEDIDALGALASARGAGPAAGDKLIKATAMSAAAGLGESTLLPLPSPSVLDISGRVVATQPGALYKGLLYDKERSMWQLFLYDGSGYRTVGEYVNELEALIAQELLSPAAIPPPVLSNGYNEFISRIPPTSGAAPPPSQLISPAIMNSPALVSPMGLGNMTIQQLLGGAPTPRDPGNSKTFRGVRFNRDMQLWQAYIVDDTGKLFFLPGGYEREEDAARAHDMEAQRQFGAAAELNFPPHAMVGGPVPSAERDSSAGGLLIDNPHAPGPHMATPGGVQAGAPGYYAPYPPAQGQPLGRPPRPDMPMLPNVQHASPAPPGSTGRRRGRPPASSYAQPLEADPGMAGMMPPPKSKYRGVVWDPDSGRWRAQLLNDGRPVILGHFGTQEEAARQYDMAVVKGNRKERTNFPPSFYKDGRRGSPANGRSRGHSSIRVTSQYKGVSWNSACSKWVAVLWDRELKRARHIGSFESEEDAARAYDREAIKMLGPEAGLNFRESLTDYIASTGGSMAYVDANLVAAKGSSQFRGVSWHERSQRWEVRVWGGGKQHFIGSFVSEVEAARAYDKAVLRLRGQDARSRSRMNFPVTDYNLEEIANEPIGDFMFGGAPPPGQGGGAHDMAHRRRRKRRHDEDIEESELGEYEEEPDPEASRASYPGSQTTSMMADGGAGGGVVFPGDAMRMIRDLSAQAGLDAPAPMPEVSVRFDPEEHHWLVLVPATNTIIGAYGTETEAQAAAQSYVLNTLGNILAARGVTPEAFANTAGAQGGQPPPGYPVEAPQGAPPMGMHGAPMQPAIIMGPNGTQYVMQPVMQGGADMMEGGYEPPGGYGGPGRSRMGRRPPSASGADMGGYDAGDPTYRQPGVGPTGLTAPAHVAPGARGKSQFRGVSWCEKVRKWRALLWDGQKQRFLGHFTTDHDAARAYDRALIELKGPDAKTNFPTASYAADVAMDGRRW